MPKSGSCSRFLESLTMTVTVVSSKFRMKASCEVLKNGMDVIGLTLVWKTVSSLIRSRQYDEGKVLPVHGVQPLSPTL